MQSHSFLFSPLTPPPPPPPLKQTSSTTATLITLSFTLFYNSLEQAPDNVVGYTIVGDDRASEFFFINPNTGVVTLLKSVKDTNINLFRV